MLVSDYALVSEADRAAFAAVRATASTASTPTQSARTKRANLAREAASRRVHLHLLPVGFSRGRRNSSFVRGHRGFRRIHWHIDVVLSEEEEARQRGLVRRFVGRRQDCCGRRRRVWAEEGARLSTISVEDNRYARLVPGVDKGWANRVMKPFQRMFPTSGDCNQFAFGGFVQGGGFGL